MLKYFKTGHKYKAYLVTFLFEDCPEPQYVVYCSDPDNYHPKKLHQTNNKEAAEAFLEEYNYALEQ